jgi:aminopeptidase S
VESLITASGVNGSNPAATLRVGSRSGTRYRGDLTIELIAPDGTAYRLKNPGDGGADDVVETYTVDASAEIANGTWRLRVRDGAAQDMGTIDAWGLTF